MLSLKKIIENQCDTGTDTGEAKLEKKDNDKFLQKSLHTVTQDDKITILLKSNQQTEVLYALTYVMKSCEKGDDCLHHLPKITELMESTSQVLEYAAVTTVQAFAKKYPRDVLHISYDKILTRFMFFPSEEYMEIICILLPNITPDNFNGRLLPILIEMLKSDEKFQYSAAKILTLCTFNSENLTNEVFLQFLESQILVSNYLLPITQKAIAANGQQWFKTFLLPHLTTLSNSKEYSRVGVVKTVLTLCTEFNDTGVYSFLLSAFAWGSESELVAAEILDNCEFIMQTKKSEFGPKLKDFAMKLQQSSDVSLRIRVLDIISKHEQILYGSETHIKQFIKNAAEDQSIDVKAEFLSHIEIFFQLAPNNNIKEQIYKYFIDYFAESDEVIRELLLQSKYYSLLGAAKLTYMLSSFIRFAQLSGDKWRQFATSVHIFINFPDETVISGMKAMAAAINQAISRSPFALADSCFGFYTRITYLVKPQHYDWLAQTVIKTYAQSKSHQLRALYSQLAFILGSALPFDIFSDTLWPPVYALSHDPVASVRVSFLRALPKFSDYFKQQGDDETGRAIATMYLSFGNDPDPYVKYVYAQLPKKTINRHNSEIEAKIDCAQSFSSGSTLPNLVKGGGSKKPPQKPTPANTLIQNHKFKTKAKSLSIKTGVPGIGCKRPVIPHRFH